MIGLSGTVWPMHMGVACMALAERYVTGASKKQKNSGKSYFLLGGLTHGRVIFRVGAAFMAAHLPPTVVWGLNSTSRVISPKRPKPRPLSEK